MNNINITMELCAEDRARLDRIEKLLAEIAPDTYHLDALGHLAEAPAEPKLWPEGLDAAPEAVPDEPVEPETAPEPVKEEEAPKYTTEDVRQKVIGLIGKGKRDEAQAIVFEYGKKISDIPADKADEAMERLMALEA